MLLFDTRAENAILGPWCETAKIVDFTINVSSVSLPCSAQEECHVLVDFLVASIDRGTDHFCCFAPGPEIVFPFTLFKKNRILTECGTSPLPTRMITAFASPAQQLHACCELKNIYTRYVC